jgi:glycosyltransferase involved in cell wall biosynthesis
MVFLPNGIDTSKFSPATVKERSVLRKRYGLPQDKVLGLFVGRFVAKKGFVELLKLETIEGAELVFAGGDSPAGHSRDDHHFLGPVDRANVQDIFKMCDVFILPSRGEGFPLTVQEAMSCGLAVITTDDPAYDAYALDESLVMLIEPSSSTVALALKTVVEVPDLRNEMGVYSREYALSHFDDRMHIADLLSIYGQSL